MRRIHPIHAMTLFLLIGLVLVALIFRGQIPLWRDLLFRYTLWIGVLIVFKATSDRNVMGRAGTFINDFSPLLFIILIFLSLGDLIQHLHADVDPSLIRIDYFLFGVHPTVWIERWIVPWLTDVLSLAYFSYYFLAVTLVLTLYLRNRKEDFNEAVFVVLLGYYLSFIGYILFPAIGPRYTLTHLQTVPLEGSFLTDFVRDIVNLAEHNKRDCMPSGHTQIALMVLFLSYRFKRVLFYILLPFVSGLILSTVYLRYHYVIDLLAGTALAIACVIIGPRLYKKWTEDRRPKTGTADS
ncbi:MAG: phosphatase PAP2 family protein [Deltaproteobacteria bacterium]